jgi:trans-aconitate methyltransferase
MSSQTKSWNSELYQSSHSFVWEYGCDLLGLLAAKPDERILDLGCGTGQLTAEIAKCGALMTGADSSAEMIARARKNYPAVSFDVADATKLPYREEFDAVFSNAALHWIRDQPVAVRSIAQALKPGGRLVFEMGGHGNLQQVLDAGCAAMRSLDVKNPEALIPWYFPTVGEYASLLESAGFDVKVALHFDRPTTLDDGERGLANWIEMFAGFALNAVSAKQKPELIARWEASARPKLFHDGGWTADYKRLRMVALRT